MRSFLRNSNKCAPGAISAQPVKITARNRTVIIGATASRMPTVLFGSVLAFLLVSGCSGRTRRCDRADARPDSEASGLPHTPCLLTRGDTTNRAFPELHV